MRPFTALLLLLVAFSPPAFGQVGKLYPLDEADQDPAFYALRERLIDAVAKRDADFVRAQLATDIKSSFGGDEGLEGFETFWRPEDPDSKLWPRLGEVLAGGGSFQGPEFFEAPYWSASFPSDELNAYDYGSVIGKNVNVRAAASLQAGILTTLSYDIVHVLEWHPGEDAAENASEGWITIELADSRKGYVASRYLRGAAGYRAGFRKTGNRWLIQWFLAGD